MDLKEMWTRRTPRTGLIGIEKISVIYGLFTTLVVLLLFNRMDNALQMLAERAAIAVGLGVAVLIYSLRPCRLTFFLRVAYQVCLLAYWYPDTYSFCRQFPYLDHVFAGLDQEIFHCQPALVFSKVLDGKFWSELFNLGYFSYYPMIAVVILYALLACYHRFEKTTFILVGSFLCYYLIYIFLPVAGPQYYYQAVGLENVKNGVFPAVIDWFQTHTELPATSQHGGFFRWLVELMQASGERPTAAFPSSHVGVTAIMLILARKMSKGLFWTMFPFFVLLCMATVYIQAHYLVDVIAGLITAGIFYQITHWLYYLKFFHREHRMHRSRKNSRR